MGDDQELQRTEQGSARIHVAVPNTATILDALALVPGVYLAVLGFSSVQYLEVFGACIELTIHCSLRYKQKVISLYSNMWSPPEVFWPPHAIDGCLFCF